MFKGFKNPNYIDYQTVNIGQLNVFNDKDEVTVEKLVEKNLVAKKNQPVKLLGGKGELEKTLTITVHKASASAIKMVEAKKGKVKLLSKEKKEVAQKEAPKEETKKEE